MSTQEATTGQAPSTFQLAFAYWSADLSLIPIKPDGSKAPFSTLLPWDDLLQKHVWKPYQGQRPSHEDLIHWFVTSTGVGIGIVGGAISGNLEIIDFDQPDLCQLWQDMLQEVMPGLLRRLPCVLTPRQGWHVYYRCPVIEGNQKLAESRDKKTLIETRGDGGYVIAPGSPLACHPLKQPYQLIRGDLTHIPTITPDERQILLSSARSFNERPKKRVSQVQARTSANGERPGDLYNSRMSWQELMHAIGATVTGTRGEATLWKRPGKTTPGHSAITGNGDDMLYVFSSNFAPFEPETAYDRFGAYTTWFHGGDFSVAAKALFHQGYGRNGDDHVEETLRLTSGSFGSGSPGGSPVFANLQPLPDPLPNVEPFEPNLLPEAFRPWIQDIAERMQCPLDFPAVAIMVAIASVVGRKVVIRPKKQDDWRVVPNLWGGVIGRPGVLKTPAIQEPLRPLYRLEYDADLTYQDLLDQWKVQQIVAKEQEKVSSQQIREALKKGHDATSIAETLVSGDDRQPSRTRYMVNDTTVEKLGELLNENPNGLLVFRDELTGVLRQLDRDGHESDRAFYLEAWNGYGRFKYDRISRGTIDIEAACVSILGGIQPGPLGHYLRSALQGGEGDDGLMQRFQLLVWPDISKDWVNVDRWPDSQARQKAYQVFTRLNKLCAADIRADIDEDLDGIPYVRFSEDAQVIFDDWRATLEIRLRHNHEHPAIEAHLAKYRSLIPSLALLIHLADGGQNPVGVDAIERACAWGEYLESHAKRVYSQGLDPDDIAARVLADRITGGDLVNGFTTRDVYRHCWSGLSSREEVQKGIDVLVELGWLAEHQEVTGGRPSMTYIINPLVKEASDDMA